MLDKGQSAQVENGSLMTTAPDCFSALRPQSFNSSHFNRSTRGRKSSPHPASAVVTSLPDSSNRANQAL